jgi:hypothetical protein
MAVDLSNVDDDKQYHVQINKVIKTEHIVLTPTSDNIVKGVVLKSWPIDSIDSFEEYVPGPP